LETGSLWAYGCPHGHLIISSRALAAFGQRVFPMDTSSSPAEPWQSLGKPPDFSQRIMSERTRKVLNGLKID